LAFKVSSFNPFCWQIATIVVSQVNEGVLANDIAIVTRVLLNEANARVQKIAADFEKKIHQVAELFKVSARCKSRLTTSCSSSSSKGGTMPLAKKCAS
jgi:hypothetical protein